jgi:hypothetical protein
VPVVLVPADPQAGPAPNGESGPQLIVPSGKFQLDEAVTIKAQGRESFAVLTKLVDQGPGYEIYECVAVNE